MTTIQSHLLCHALDIRQQQPVMWRRELLPGYNLCLRPVSLHTNTDLQAIHNWLAGADSTRLPVDQLRVLFILIAESTYAQAFMVLLNEETPVGQFEVYQVLQDELKDAITDAAEGDYRLYIPVIPALESWPDITVRILQFCLTWILSCSEVKRVFWVVPAANRERNRLAVKAGLSCLKTCHDISIENGQPANIYCLNRDSIGN